MENVTDKLTTAHPGPFRLMELPGEMRNEIYRQYFDSFEINNTDTRLEKVQPCLNILHANSQQRSEAAKIFYKEYIGRGPINPSSAGYYDVPARWEIEAGSGPVMFRRLRAFSSSLNTFEVDIPFCLSYGTSKSHKPLTRAFVDAVWEHLNRQLWYPDVFEPTNFDIKGSLRLAGGRDNSDVISARDITSWPGTRRQNRTTSGYRLRMTTADRPVYFLEYDAEFNHDPGSSSHPGHDERFRLRGKLARIDWTWFEFKFGELAVNEEPHIKYDFIYSSVVELKGCDMNFGGLRYCHYRCRR